MSEEIMNNHMVSLLIKAVSIIDDAIALRTKDSIKLDTTLKDYELEKLIILENENRVKHNLEIIKDYIGTKIEIEKIIYKK